MKNSSRKTIFLDFGGLSLWAKGRASVPASRSKTGRASVPASRSMTVSFKIAKSNAAAAVDSRPPGKTTAPDYTGWGRYVSLEEVC